MIKKLDVLVTKLNVLAINLCEILPLDITLFEREGFCRNPSDYCSYWKKIEGDVFSCNKKSYTFTFTHMYNF